MLFKWLYNEHPGVGRADTLKMGSISVGQVYQTTGGLWRVVCDLPDSSLYGGNFIDDFTSKGIATATLEIICTQWVNKSGLWTTLFAPDTLAENKPEQG